MHQSGRTTTKIKTQSWSKEVSVSRHQSNRMMSATQFKPDFSNYNLSRWPMSSTISCFNTWLRILRRNNQARTTTRTLDAPGLKQRAAALSSVHLHRALRLQKARRSRFRKFHPVLPSSWESSTGAPRTIHSSSKPSEVSLPLLTVLSTTIMACSSLKAQIKI
jgi:hypothetical protein